MKWWYVMWTNRRPGGSKPCRYLPRGKGEFRLRKGREHYLLTFTFGKGIWLAARVEVTPGVYPDFNAGEVFRRPSMKKRVSAAAGGDQPHLAPMETTRFGDLLPLVEHAAIRRYDDGDPRETGWFTVKTQGAAWVVQVKDPDSACSFSAVGETLDKALETAALLLGCDEAPWEPDSFLAASKARRKK